MYEKQMGTMPEQPSGRAYSAMAGAPAIEQKALFSACDRLEKQLMVIAEAGSRVNQFQHRLLNPRPEKVGKDSTANQAQGTSLEGRLMYLVHIANEIGESLHATATELERAV